MPDLTIQVQEVKGLASTALVVLNGSIDAKTVIQFQTQLNSVKERGLNRFILDMENVKYVNSTGLGYLINLSDSVSSDKGGITLVKVQPKVKVVFDMLGLNAFFKIYPTRDEAMKHFTSEAVASPTDQTAIMRAAKEPGPAVAPSRAPTVPTAVAEPPPRPAPVPAPTHAPTPAPAPAVAAEETLDCQCCRAPLTLRETGTYKCPRCLALFNYLGHGRATFLPKRGAPPVQLSLNFSEEATEGLLGFVRSMAKRSGFTDGAIPELEGAVRDAVRTVRRHAYSNNDGQVYHVMFLPAPGELEVRIADYGSTIAPDRSGEDGRPVFSTVKGAVDRFELRHHPKGGNVITLAKKVR